MGNPIVPFEVIGADPERLRSYYADRFGWTYAENAPVVVLSLVNSPIPRET